MALSATCWTGVPDADESSERLFTIVHGRKSGLRERIPALEFIFDQQFLFGQDRQWHLVLLEVGIGEAQHFIRNHEKLSKSS